MKSKAFVLSKSIRLIIVLAIALTGGMVFANGQGEADMAEEISEEVTIEFMHVYGETHGAPLQSIADEFMRQNPLITVEMVYADGAYEGAVEKLQLLGASGLLPDVSISGLQYHQLIQNNLPAVNISSLIAEDNFDTSQYFDSFLEFGRNSDGDIIGLPFAVSNPTLYYNKQFFEQAGLDPESPPETFEEVRSTAKILTEKLGIDGMAYSYDMTGAWMIQALVETRGGSLIKDGEMNLESEEVKDVYNYLNSLVTDGSMGMLSTGEASMGFLTGNVAMVATSSALGPVYTANLKMPWGSVRFPTYNGTRQVPAGGNCLYIFSEDSAKRRASWEFVKFLTSQYAAVSVTKRLGYMSPNKTAVEEGGMLFDYLVNENAHARLMYEQTEDMVPWLNMPGNAGTRVHEIIKNAGDAIFLGEKSVDEALADANREANSVIK